MIGALMGSLSLKNLNQLIESIVDAILKLRKDAYQDISGDYIEIAKKVLQKMTENAESFISGKSKYAKIKAIKKK